MRAPVLGGNFGIWGGLFSSFDCAVKGVRQKEDAYVPPFHHDLPMTWS
jgi:import inner membrane translocase subunit TIM17